MDNLLEKEILIGIEKHFNIKKENITNIYIFGSSLYKTVKFNSDIDVLVIVKDKLSELNCQEKKSGTYDFHINTETEFLKNLNEHHIKSLECIYSPIEFKLKEENLNFKLDKIKLRHSISSISNNSWAKANKKINMENEDTYIGFKSLFHSLRIINFGIQLCKNNEIDFESQKELWNEIYEEYIYKKDWEYLKNKYKPIYNSLMSEFRLLAPKE